MSYIDTDFHGGCIPKRVYRPATILAGCLIYTVIFAQTSWFFNDELLHFVCGLGI